MKKNLICVLLAALLVFSTGCNAKKNNDTPANNDSAVTDNNQIQNESNDIVNNDDQSAENSAHPSVGNNNVVETQGNPNAQIDPSLSLSDIAAKLYENVGEMPMLALVEIAKEDSSYYFGVENMNFEQAVASEAMISAIAHSVCLAKMPEGTDMDELKAQIEQNANPAKWICVSADSITVDYIGNTIILIMDNNNPEGIHKNFLSLAQNEGQQKPEAKPEEDKTQHQPSQSTGSEQPSQSTEPKLPSQSAEPEQPSQSTEPEQPSQNTEPETIPQEQPKPETPAQTVNEIKGSLSEIMDKLYTDVGETPMLMQAEITPETSEYFLGSSNLNFTEAIVSEPMMSSIAHSVCLARFPEGTDMQAVKETVKGGVNPAKWVCVEAETVYVESHGNILLLIMDNVNPEKIRENFFVLASGKDLIPTAPKQEENQAESNELSASLSEIMEELYVDFGEAPRLMQSEITPETSEYFLGSSNLNFTEAIVSEPMMSSIAHSVCLARFPEGTDMQAVKQTVKDGVDPAKWVCVTAETVYVENIGHTLLLVMDSLNPDQIRDNFLALAQ